MKLPVKGAETHHKYTTLHREECGKVMIWISLNMIGMSRLAAYSVWWGLRKHGAGQNNPSIRRVRAYARVLYILYISILTSKIVVLYTLLNYIDNYYIVPEYYIDLFYT